MPFIGQEPITGAYSVLDDITTSATATYNLQLNSGAFSPATANQLLVSLNGVIQKPGSSFTLSGSQITFSSALTSSDSIDFIIALGDVLSVGTPTDGSVTDAKIVGMSSSKLTGALPAIDGSALTGIAGTFIAAEEGEYTAAENSISTTGTSSFAQFSGLGNATPLSYTTTQNNTTVTLILTLHNGGSSLSDVTEIEVRRSGGTVVGRHRDNSSDNAYFSSFTIVDQQNVSSSGSTVSYNIYGRTIGGGNPQSVRYNRKYPKWIWLEAAQ